MTKKKHCPDCFLAVGPRPPPPCLTKIPGSAHEPCSTCSYRLPPPPPCLDPHTHVCYFLHVAGLAIILSRDNWWNCWLICAFVVCIHKSFSRNWVQKLSCKEVLAIRRIFSLTIKNTKFFNCPNVFKIGVVQQ